MTSLFLTGSLLTGFHGLLCANADPSGILTLTVIEEQIPENRGCSATDLSITLAPGMNPDRERVVQIRNLAPDRCRLSRGDLVSVGISAGNLFFSGVGAEWAHRNANGRILFHVSADYATSRFFNDVYANRSKIALDFHLGGSGFFAGPQYSRVDLINPLIGPFTGPEAKNNRPLVFQGPGIEAGYQRRLGSNFVAEATVGITILGPQYDIGIAEGRIGVAWLITSSGRTPREATPRSD
jgi:hypothetical protein